MIFIGEACASMTHGFFQPLRNAFRSTGPDPSRQLFIDDYVVGGLEVLPASCRDWCAQQLQEIARFSAQHEAPGGAGWTDVHVRPAAPASIADLSIPFAPAVEALGRRLACIEEVITGSLTAPQVIHRARAFGPSPLTAVVLYGGEGLRHVGSIELTLRSDEAEVLAVLEAMAALPSPEPLLVVNWQRGCLARIGDRSEVERFASP
jgi:hypothetical protein